MDIVPMGTKLGRNFGWILFVLLVFQLLMPILPAAAQGGTVVWDQPVMLSDPQFTAWPVTIAADSAGNVHMMWSQTLTTDPPPGEGDTIFYARWDGQQLSEPIDVIVSPEGASASPRLTITPDGMLHVVWQTGSQNAKLLYSRAPACCADNPKNWILPQSLGGPVLDKPAFVADSSGRLHAAFAAGDNSNIVYVRSDDGGDTWPVLVEILGNAQLSDEFAVYPRLAVDGKGRVHIVWSVGPFPGRRVMYVRSDDGGDTWSDPEEIDTWQRKDYLDGFAPTLIDIEAVGDDEIHLIWDGAPTIERTHIWSADGGITWTPFFNRIFPTVSNVGRSGYNDMELDGAGTLHAISIHGNDNALHAAWNNGVWTLPIEIPTLGAAEEPQITISQGNIIHFVWTDKKTDIFTNWYVRGQIEGVPAIASEPLPTIEPTPVPTPFPTAQWELVISSTVTISNSTNADTSQWSDLEPAGRPVNPGMLIMVSLVPSSIILGGMVLIVYWRVKR